MKIIESETKISENLKSWVDFLTIQDLDTFLTKISSFSIWEFEDLEDLTPLAPLLNKIDSYLLTYQPTQDLQDLDKILVFSFKIVSAAFFKGHFASLPELVGLLDAPSWRTCKNILKLIHLVIGDIQTEKLEVSIQAVLDQKVFAVFVCGFVETSHLLTLKQVLIETESQKASKEIPKGLESSLIPFYCGLVERYNLALQDSIEKQNIICCKIIAAQIFISKGKLTVFFNLCSLNEQENWFFSGLEELINLNVSSEISAESLVLIGKVIKELKQQKKIRWPPRFNINIQEQVKLWSRLVVQILNSISTPNSYYPEDEYFTLSVLELIPVSSRFIYAEHNIEYQCFTISLLNMIKKPSIETKSKLVLYHILKHLVGLMNKSIKYFRDNDGPTVIIDLLKSLINEHLQSRTVPSNLKLLKNTLKFFKILLERWEEIYNGLDEMTPVIIETRLIECFTEVFNSKLCEVFEEVLAVVFPITQVSISPEFNKLFFDLASAVLLASDSNFPSTIKQADILARFLCSIPQGNNEMINIIEKFQILSRIIFIVGTGSVSIQTLQISSNIAENLQELVISLPDCRNQAVEGVTNLLRYLVSHKENEHFAVQVSNVGNILCSLMINNSEIVRKLLDSQVVELIFEVFHVKIRPSGLNNELYKLNAFFKVVPDGSVAGILKKIITEIQSALEKIMYFTDVDVYNQPSETEDFYDQVLLVDCYIDSFRTLIQKNSSLPVNHKELSELLTRLSVIQRFLIKKQSEKLTLSSKPQVSSFSISPDLSVIENQELKTPEENWMFMCQLSIRKLFRAIIKIPNRSGRQESSLDYYVIMGKTIGQILIDPIKSINFSVFSHSTGYYYSLLLSDLIKIMYNEQIPSPLFLLGFIQEEGISHFTALLSDLQAYSKSLNSSFPQDFHLVNSVQIIWSLCGRLLENFISEKFNNYNLGSIILKPFGFSTSKEVGKKMKEIVAHCLNTVGYLDPGVYSTNFAKSVLAILKYLTSCNKEVTVVDPQCLNMLVSMGFSRQVAKQALVAVRRNSVETATEWIFAHPEALSASNEDFCEDQIMTEHIFEQILAAIPLIPSLSSLIADCLAQISVSSEVISQKITMKIVNMIGQIVFMLGGYSGLANVDEMMERDVSWEQLDAYSQVLQIISQKNQQVFDYLHSINFTLHGFRILAESPACHLIDKWAFHLLILLDYIGKTGQVSCQEIIKIVIELLRTHNTQIAFNVNELNYLISILNNFLTELQFVEYFVQNQGVQELLLLKSPKENCDLICQNRIWTNLIVKIAKDPKTLFACFQSKVLRKVRKNVRLEDFLKDCKKYLNKSHELFFAAVRSVVNFSNKSGTIFILPKKQIDFPSFPTWDSMNILCNCLSELFYADTSHVKSYILNTNNLLEFLSIALDSCPLLISSLLDTSFEVFCPYTQVKVSGVFIENFVKIIVPFRYQLKFSNMSYLIPTTDIPLPQATSEHWTNICVRLLSQFCLHRVPKYLEKVNINEEQSTESALNVTVQLFNSLLTDATQPDWHKSYYNRTIISILPAVLTDLLLAHCPNENKPTCNCIVLARTLSTQSLGLLPRLLQIFPNLDYETCPKSLLKHLLKLTELLLRYNLISILQNNDKWELLRSSEYIQFKEHFSHSEAVQEAESPTGEIDESPNLLAEFSGEEGFISLRNSERGNEREVFESNLPSQGIRVFTGSLLENGPNRRAWLMHFDESQIYDFIMSNRNRDQYLPTTNETLPDRQVRRIYLERPELVSQFIQDVQQNSMDLIPTSSDREEKKVGPGLSEDPSIDRSIDPSFDPEFLAALPDDIRTELLASQINLEEPGQNMLLRNNGMDTIGFINSLSSELRREVLASLSEEVINSLPEDVANEANSIQERLRIRPRISQKGGMVMQARKNNPTGFEVFVDLEKNLDFKQYCSDSGFDDNEVVTRLFRPSAEVFTSLFRGFEKGAFCNRLFGMVLLSLSAHPQNLKTILRALILMITNYQIGEEKKNNVNELLESSINTLLFITKHNKNVKFLLAYDWFAEFQKVIELIDSDQFSQRPFSLCILLKLISRVFKSAEGRLVNFNPESLTKLIKVLKQENLTEKSLNKLAMILNILSQNAEIKGNLLIELENSLSMICQEIQQKLTPDQVLSISKESQVFKICQVLKNISGSSSVTIPLWGPLSDCISKLPSQTAAEDQCLKKLLPLIQAFFITHSPQDLPKSFWQFTETCSKHLNRLIHRNFELLEGPLKILVTDFSFILDFENKRQYFNEKLKEQKRGKAHGSLRLNVRRTDVFTDSFHQLKAKTPEEMQSKLRVQFAKEDGIDAGGLAREWFGLLSREIFNPNYALFIPSPNGATFQPNSMSHVNQDHLQFFKFVGRVVGKAVCDGFTLDVYFTRSFYKHILGQEISYQDMEDIDVGFYKNLKSLVDINLNDNDLHEYYFCYEEQEFGTVTVKELLPGGSSIQVTETNKLEYIKLLCHMKMTKNIQAQLQAFKSGFYEMISPQLISIFSSKELELLISGLPTFDVADLKRNTEYYNYNKDSPVVVWFWKALEDFSEEERAEFLQFVTGSSKVPIEGFKALPGMDGPQKFQIHKSFASKERLPTAHTCINQLDMPEYGSEEELRNKLKLAIREGNEGFGFA